jgi:hypothetical protein
MPISIDLGIVTLILSVLALVISLLGFLDNRSKTRILREQTEDNRNKTAIMQNQLKLLQEQSESKQDIRNATAILGEIQERIAKFNVGKYDWGDFGRLAPQKLLEALHDSGKQSIVWDVRPYSIFGRAVGDNIMSEAKSFDAFRRLFETIAPVSKADLTIRFLSSPKIEINTDVEIQEVLVKDYVTDIYSLLVMYEKLKSVETVVDMYDHSLISDIQKVYFRITGALYERMNKSYELEISSKIKAKELPSHLLRFVSLDVWNGCVNELRDAIIPRISEATRRLRESV